jgi:predicted GIY-YIG superfamily endonuclease
MRNVPGTVYLLHFSKPFGHAKHYCGFATDLEARIQAHRAGQGARLMTVIKAAGIDFTLARTWQGTRARERQLKKQGGASRRCPTCKEERKMTAQQESTGPEVQAADPGRVGAEAAQQIIAAQAAAGMSVDRMAHHHHDTASWLFSEATTSDAEKYAEGYAWTAEMLIGELREKERPVPDRSPGAPHPDPFLAERGWQACGHGDGVYVRRPVRQVNREAEAC